MFYLQRGKNEHLALEQNSRSSTKIQVLKPKVQNKTYFVSSQKLDKRLIFLTTCLQKFRNNDSDEASGDF